MTSAEHATDTKEFFAELNTGRKFRETTISGKSVDLVVVSPSVKSVDLASEIVGSLDYPPLGVSQNELRKKLVRLACVSCIDGITEDNVMAFLYEIDESSEVIRRCLKLLGLDHDDLKRIEMGGMPF